MLSFVSAFVVGIFASHAQLLAPGAPVPGAAVPAVPATPATATPITCGEVVQATFNEPKLSLSLKMAYRGDVNFYLQSGQNLQFSSIRALDTLTGAELGLYNFVSNWKQGYLSIADQPLGKEITLEMTGTGVDQFWAMCQCKEITPAPTTAPPTPPPTPLASGNIQIGKQRCGAGIIGNYGSTPAQTGTIALEIEFQQPVGHMALYVNGLKATKLSAYKKTLMAPLPPVMPQAFGPGMPMQAPVTATTGPQWTWTLIGETTRAGTQYLYLPGMQMGDQVTFHMQLEGKGKYYAITNCETPRPTMSPTTPAPTTAMPTPEVTPVVPP